MPLKIWSLLAGTSIALQSISVLFSTLLLPLPRCWLWIPTDLGCSGLGKSSQGGEPRWELDDDDGWGYEGTNPLETVSGASQDCRARIPMAR